MNKREYKLLKKFVEKVFSKANADPQTFDFDSEIDMSLGYQENKEMIVEKLRTLGILTKELEIELGLITKKDLEAEERAYYEMYERYLEEYIKEERNKILEKSIPEVEKYFEPIFNKIEILLNSENKRGLLIVGSQGIGKTFNTIAYLTKKNVNFEYLRGHITPLAFYIKLHNNNNSLFVLDDIVSLLKNDDIVSILLGALDKDGLVEWTSSQKIVEIPDRFKFNGKIIIIANKLSKEDDPFVQAIIDRCIVFEFVMSREKKVSLLYEMAKYKKLPFELVDFLVDNLVDPTLRDLELIEDVYKTFPNRWREEFLEIKERIDEDLREVLNLFKQYPNLSNNKKAQMFVEKTGKCRKTFYNYLRRLRKLGFEI